MDGANPGAQLSVGAAPPLLKIEKQDYVSGDRVDAIAQGCHEVSALIKCSPWRFEDPVHRQNQSPRSAYPTLQPSFFLSNRTLIFPLESLLFRIQLYFSVFFAANFLAWFSVRDRYVWGFHSEGHPSPLLPSPLPFFLLSPFLIPAFCE